MEVFVRGFEQQTTRKEVHKYFRPIFQKVQISVFYCFKITGQSWAKITITDRRVGQQFLDRHGEPPIRGVKPKHQLQYRGKKLYCSESKQQPDEYVVKSLQREESERQRSDYQQPRPSEQGSKLEQRTFKTHSFECGSLGYSKITGLGFVKYCEERRMGCIIFGRQSANLELYPINASTHDPKHLIIFKYDAIESILVGSPANPYIVLSSNMAPRIFKEDADVDEDLVVSMARLGIISLSSQMKQQKDRRSRVTGISKSHSLIAGTCFSYVLRVGPTIIQQLKILNKISGLPKPIPWDLGLVTKAPWPEQMTYLNAALSVNRYKTFSFELKFQLQKLVLNAFLPPYKVVRLMDLLIHYFTGMKNPTMASAIRKFCNQIPWAGPETKASDLSTKTFRSLLEHNYEASLREEAYAMKISKQQEHIASIHRAMITPTGIYLSGPDPEMKNSILRKYSTFHSYFLQVSFLEEDGEGIRYDRESSADSIYHDRFKEVLEGTITVAGRPYEFLGFSHSSLRARTCWFMAPFTWNGELRHARAVIKDIGDFTVFRSPPRCAARIGQAFSQTFSSVEIPGQSVFTMDDVARTDSMGIVRTFSDGVGTCSKSILKKIWAAYAQSSTWKPTVCQIRHSGAKGMISLDDRLGGEVDQLYLRRSMIKFEVPYNPFASSTRIEICGAGFKPLPMYLNRPLIKILEDLGVQPQAFLDLQTKAVETLRITTESAINAGYFLQRNHIGKAARLPWLFRKLHYIGLSFSEDNFLRNALELAIIIQLRELKYRSRILVEEGMTVYGIMDETGLLEEGQIYLQTMNKKVLTGEVTITRSPARHPGDVQIVTAIDVPQWSPLRSLHNCVVFSRKGDRDLPSKLSGGDLDGDLYNIIYDESLKPQRISEPADYPTIPPIDIGREVTRSDMTDFFIQFMKNDQLGRLSTIHETLADQRDSGTFDPDCIVLAELCSTAVDFSKTGHAADLSRIPRYSNVRPDFQAPGPRVLIENSITLGDATALQNDDDDDDIGAGQAIRYYESTKILGELYRAIDEHVLFAHIQCHSRNIGNFSLLDKIWQYVQSKVALIQYEHHTQTARDIKEAYEENMVSTMIQYSSHPKNPVSEVEVFCGAILGKEGKQSKRQRESSTSMKEKHDRDVAYTVTSILQGQEEGWDDEDGGVPLYDVEQKSSEEEALERSIACLDIGIHEARTRPKIGRLVSFAWVAASVCLREVDKFCGR